MDEESGGYCKRPRKAKENISYAERVAQSDLSPPTAASRPQGARNPSEASGDEEDYIYPTQDSEGDVSDVATEDHAASSEDLDGQTLSQPSKVNPQAQTLPVPPFTKVARGDLTEDESSTFAALEQIRKEHDSRNSPFPSFASVFEIQNCQQWIVQRVYRDSTKNLYRLILSAPTFRGSKTFLFEHTPIEEDARHFGTNLVTLLKHRPFDEIEHSIAKRFLIQLAIEMTWTPATIDLRVVALEHKKCVSDIDYFVRDNHSPTVLTPTRYNIAAKYSDVNVERSVPRVPLYVHFRPPMKNPGYPIHHESLEAQVARRIVQWICWKYHGSIATPETMRQEVMRLLEKSFLKTRVSIFYTSDQYGRHMIAFNMRYFNTELKSDQLYEHKMTGTGMTHWENTDDLPDCRYGRSGKPKIPEGVDAEARGRCERLILLARRVCSELKNFEGTPSKLHEQITKMKEPYMGTSHKNYRFKQIMNTDALKPTPRKRKRPSPKQLTLQKEPAVQPNDTMDSTPAVQQWACNPDSFTPMKWKPSTITSKLLGNAAVREQARKTALSQRPPWLVDILDMDQNPPSHPDYDPRTLFIPKAAMDKLQPFDKWYWGLKQKFWNTIFFVQMGNCYELFENDAEVGHQMFDLQLLDRVYMCSVKVRHLTYRVSELVAKGYRVALADQVEPALAKEVQIRNGLGATEVKQMIQRKLTKIITGGTVVDTDMIDTDMSIYCAAIKESKQDGQPAFGIAFVDAASGRFSLTDFVDDNELTKFETFIAQIRPRELLLEKSCTSIKALRILKYNSAPTTLWNHLKSGKEFWTADTSCREIDAGQYFINEEGDSSEAWPTALQEAKEKLVMSAYGTLLRYLSTLQIGRDIMTLKNVSWYDPIKNASSLVLDGKTLNQLGVFVNPLDRGPDGTLLSVLNCCITPFGKRMFQQWVCHPLKDAAKINSRLDAVESLLADPTVRDQFISNLTKIPDLERMIFRIHTGSCKVQDFVRVINGFEQIDYMVSLVRDAGLGEGIVRQLISNMPEITESIEYWNAAFDHAKAKEAGVLIPERGKERDFDESQDHITKTLADLDTLLKKTRKQLNSTAIKYKYSYRRFRSKSKKFQRTGIKYRQPQSSSGTAAKSFEPSSVDIKDYKKATSGSLKKSNRELRLPPFGCCCPKHVYVNLQAFRVEERKAESWKASSLVADV